MPILSIFSSRPVAGQLIKNIRRFKESIRHCRSWAAHQNMGRYGITNTELNWFQSYLSYRKQTVSVNGEPQNQCR